MTSAQHGRASGLYDGFIATGAGETRVQVELDGASGRVVVTARWMGSEPLEVELLCRHQVCGTHAGGLVVDRARVPGSDEIPLPPSDGSIVLEYVRVPPQPAVFAGSDEMAAVGRWTDPFALVVWLHREAVIDDGTDLEPEAYAVPPARFRPVVDALDWLRRPWKLGDAASERHDDD